MLEQFRVNLEDAVFVQSEDLKATVAAVFEKMGVEPADAQLGADVLVLADLRGVDSHGVSNMLKSYITGYQEGLAVAVIHWRHIEEAVIAAVFNAFREEAGDEVALPV